MKGKTVDFFTTPDDLGMKIATSVHNYLEENKPISAPIFPPKPTGNTLPPLASPLGARRNLTSSNPPSPLTPAPGERLIDGPGGIGKTALAIKAAHDAPAELFERKIFITAKVRELTAEGEAKLTDFTRPTYLAMLDELGKELGEDGSRKTRAR